MSYMWNCPQCGYNHVDGNQCPYCGNTGSDIDDWSLDLLNILPIKTATYWTCFLCLEKKINKGVECPNCGNCDPSYGVRWTKDHLEELDKDRLARLGLMGRRLCIEIFSSNENKYRTGIKSLLKELRKDKRSQTFSELEVSMYTYLTIRVWKERIVKLYGIAKKDAQLTKEIEKLKKVKSFDLAEQKEKEINKLKSTIKFQFDDEEYYNKHKHFHLTIEQATKEAVDFLNEKFKKLDDELEL